MSTARQADRLNETAVIPTVPARRSILHAATSPSPFSGWRGHAVTEELEAVPARRSALPRRPSQRTGVRRHLRAALTGTLLAIVAVTGLSSYAAAGVADARSTAPCQAHITCR